MPTFNIREHYKPKINKTTLPLRFPSLQLGHEWRTNNKRVRKQGKLDCTSCVINSYDSMYAKKPHWRPAPTRHWHRQTRHITVTSKPFTAQTYRPSWWSRQSTRELLHGRKRIDRLVALSANGRASGKARIIQFETCYKWQAVKQIRKCAEGGSWV